MFYYDYKFYKSGEEYIKGSGSYSILKGTKKSYFIKHSISRLERGKWVLDETNQLFDENGIGFRSYGTRDIEGEDDLIKFLYKTDLTYELQKDPMLFESGKKEILLIRRSDYSEINNYYLKNHEIRSELDFYFVLSVMIEDDD